MGFSGAFAVSFREGICLKKNPVNRQGKHLSGKDHTSPVGVRGDKTSALAAMHL